MAEVVDKVLAIRGLRTGYDRKVVVYDVSLDVSPGEIVAIIGHNGAGKSTVLKAIFGLLAVWDGEILINQTTQKGMSPRSLLRAGVVYLPQGNRVFPNLTVRENLELGANTIKNKVLVAQRVERSLGWFPSLRGRLDQWAGTLSGGERQILAIACALELNPRLLLLDEPSIGLAPRMVSSALEQIRQLAIEAQLGVLIVEQKVREVLIIADRVVVLRGGRITYSGPSAPLADANKLREVYL